MYLVKYARHAHAVGFGCCRRGYRFFLSDFFFICMSSVGKQTKYHVELQGKQRNKNCDSQIYQANKVNSGSAFLKRSRLTEGQLSSRQIQIIPMWFRIMVNCLKFCCFEFSTLCREDAARRLDWDEHLNWLNILIQWDCSRFWTILLHFGVFNGFWMVCWSFSMDFFFIVLWRVFEKKVKIERFEGNRWRKTKIFRTNQLEIFAFCHQIIWICLNLAKCLTISNNFIEKCSHFVSKDLNFNEILAILPEIVIETANIAHKIAK